MQFISRFVALLILFCSTSTSIAEPAEDHWSPDTDSAAWIDYQNAIDLVATGEYAKSTEVLERLSEELPDNADVFNMLGYVYRKQDMLDKSMSAYQRALSLNPEHRGALEYQGELFIKLGRNEEARANLEKLNQLCPIGCEELEKLSDALAGSVSDKW